MEISPTPTTGTTILFQFQTLYFFTLQLPQKKKILHLYKIKIILYSTLECPEITKCTRSNETTGTTLASARQVQPSTMATSIPAPPLSSANSVYPPLSSSRSTRVPLLGPDQLGPRKWFNAKFLKKETQFLWLVVPTYYMRIFIQSDAAYCFIQFITMELDLRDTFKVPTLILFWCILEALSVVF